MKHLKKDLIFFKTK